jgi:hypothetical protein
LYQAGFLKNQISAGKKHRQFAGLAFEDTHRDECVHVVSFSVYCAIRKKSKVMQLLPSRKNPPFLLKEGKSCHIILACTFFTLY